MTNRFRILHISDLHERSGPKADPWRRRLVLGETWRRGLEEIAADGTPDIVCFTGDIAYAGLADEYRLATNFVEEICKHCGVQQESIYIVPGNHDIDRGVSGTAWTELRARITPQNAQAVGEWIVSDRRPPTGFEGHWRTEILARQASYRDWVARHLGTPSLFEASRGALGYRAKVRSTPCAVHVIGLDSAWLAGDDHDHGNLLLTDEQLLRLTSEADGSAVNGLRIALVHHPLEMMADAAIARQHLAERVDILLYGHIHDTHLDRHVSVNRQLPTAGAGCLYEHNHYPNSCQVLDLELDDHGNILGANIWFRSWSRRGFWTNANDLYPGTRDGRLRWLGTNRASSRPNRRAEQFFVGRELELATLRRILLRQPPSASPEGPATVVIQGMPGLGKSYLAERFFIENRNSFPGGYLLLSLTEHEMRDEVELASELCARLGQPSGKNSPESLASALKGERALLHIENVDTPSIARTVATLIAPLQHCAVIITGRERTLGRDVFATLDLTPFTNEETALLLRTEIGEDHLTATDSQVGKLADLLHGLPLACHIAAGHLSREGKVNDAVVQSFIERMHHVVDLEPSDPADPYVLSQPGRTSLRGSILISLDHLSRIWGIEATRRLRALALVALLPPSGADISLVQQITELSNSEWHATWRDARDLSLLTRAHRTASPQSMAIAVHPFVSEVLRDRYGTPADQEVVFHRAAQWIAARLAGSIETRPSRWQQLRCERDVLGTVLTTPQFAVTAVVADEAISFAKDSGPLDAWLSGVRSLLPFAPAGLPRARLLRFAMHAASGYGEPNEARAYANELLQLAGTLPRQLLGIVLTEIAATTAEDADLGTALRQIDQACAIAKDSDDTQASAWISVERARILQRANRSIEAEREIRDALTVFEKSDNRSHLASARGRLADTIQRQGRIDEADEIRRNEELPAYRALSLRREEVICIGKIADVEHDRGKFEDELPKRLEQEIPFFEQQSDRRELAVARAKAGLCLAALGRAQDARMIMALATAYAYTVGDRAMRAGVAFREIEMLLLLGAPGEAHSVLERSLLPLAIEDDLSSAARDVWISAVRVYEALKRGHELELAEERLAAVLRNRGDIDGLRERLGHRSIAAKERGDHRTALRLARELLSYLTDPADRDLVELAISKWSSAAGGTDSVE